MDSISKYLTAAFGAMLLALCVAGYVKYESYEKKLADLRNQVASKDQTIEEMKNTYTRLASEHEDLKSSDEKLQELYKRTKQNLIAETQAKLYWKGKYEYELEHKPLPKPSDGETTSTPVKCGQERQWYRASQDVGFVLVDVDTFTADPDYRQKLLLSPGGQPLKLTLNLTRDKNRQWHTHVVSSDDRVGVDIGLNSVNIEPLEERWYERLTLRLGTGVGSSGVLVGAGASYRFGQYDLGPAIWGTTVGGGAVFYGANFGWSPFKN